MDVRRFAHVALLLIVLGANAFAATAAVATEEADPAEGRTQKRLTSTGKLTKGLEWVVSRQDESGAFLDVNGQPDPYTTAEAISLLVALRNVGFEVELDKAVAYLQQIDPTPYDVETGAAIFVAPIVMALAAAGGDPRDVGGADMVADLAGLWNAETGLYGAYLLESVLTMMALAAADEPVEEAAIEQLVAAQADDGSWYYADDGSVEIPTGDAMTTAYVVQALVALGRADEDVIAKALAYFQTVRPTEAEFAPLPGYIPDPNTTGLVLSAVIAAGENPKGKAWKAAITGLLEYQNESGGFRTSTDGAPIDDFTSTVAALIALAGAYYPVLPTT